MLSYLNNMKAETIIYTFGIIFTSVVGQFFTEFLIIHSDFIIEKLIIVIITAISQFFILIPFIKNRLRKTTETFFTELKVLKESISNLQNKIQVLDTELKDNKSYLVGVEVEVRKFYYAETEMSRALTNVNNNMTELQRLVVKLSSESGVIRTALMNKILKKEEDVK